METPAQMCARLLLALEDLTAQEAASLEARDFTATIAIQDRAAPLVELLASHGPQVADSALRGRVAALLLRRSRTGEWLAEQLARTRQELQQTQVAQRRAAQVGPVYGRANASEHQLSAIG